MKAMFGDGCLSLNHCVTPALVPIRQSELSLSGMVGLIKGVIAHCFRTVPSTVGHHGLLVTFPTYHLHHSSESAGPPCSTHISTPKPAERLGQYVTACAWRTTHSRPACRALTNAQRPSTRVRSWCSWLPWHDEHTAAAMGCSVRSPAVSHAPSRSIDTHDRTRRPSSHPA
jgi:hypothetical protein